MSQLCLNYFSFSLDIDSKGANQKLFSLCITKHYLAWLSIEDIDLGYEFSDILTDP